MTENTSYLDWNGITDRFLYIVPQGAVEDTYYNQQGTFELTEIAEKLCEAAGLPFDVLTNATHAIFCWAFRNRDVLQTCQMNGIFYFENVVILNKSAEPINIVCNEEVPDKDIGFISPLSRSEFLTNVWKDTRVGASSFPVKPSVKVIHEKLSILPVIYDTTCTEVTTEDTLVAGKRLVDAGLNPLILNFADDMEAGGVVDNGNSAQEESLWRRTNLCATQLQEFYPLRTAPQECVYSPLVTVFKDTEENDCAALTTPWTAAFIAVPGLKYPAINSQKKVCPQDMNLMREKIELIFQVGKRGGHDSLVLGALGCGVWRAPPQHVAEIMREVCNTYKGVFKHITIACLTTRGPAANNSNYTVFSNVFGDVC